MCKVILVRSQVTVSGNQAKPINHLFRCPGSQKRSTPFTCRLKCTSQDCEVLCSSSLGSETPGDLLLEFQGAQSSFRDIIGSGNNKWLTKTKEHFIPNCTQPTRLVMTQASSFSSSLPIWGLRAGVTCSVIRSWQQPCLIVSCIIRLSFPLPVTDIGCEIIWNWILAISGPGSLCCLRRYLVKGKGGEVYLPHQKIEIACFWAWMWTIIQSAQWGILI